MAKIIIKRSTPNQYRHEIVQEISPLIDKNLSQYETEANKILNRIRQRGKNKDRLFEVEVNYRIISRWNVAIHLFDRAQKEMRELLENKEEEENHK